MFGKIKNAVQSKVQELATPENLAKAREIAAKAAQQAKSAGVAVKQYADQRVESVADKHAKEHVREHISSAIDSVKRGAMRGAELVDCTSPQMIEKLKSSADATTISIGNVPISRDDEQQHFLLCGAPGTGKSVEIKKALRTIRNRGQRAVVYDVSGELVSLFYRPEIDHILNPLDARGEKWNPWLDAEQFEFAAMAKSLVPDAKGGQADPFWSEAGRAVLESLLMECQNLDELISNGLSAPLTELAGLVKSAGFEGMIGTEKMFQSTRSTLAVYLRSLGMLPNVSRNDDTAFSIRKWLEKDDGSWLFLSVPSRARDSMKPLVSLWLDTVTRQAMSLRPDPNRRIWLALDELPSLNKIPSLSPALAEGRKFGLAAIIGIQAYGQLQEAYGKELAAALWGLPKTRLYLRISDAETAEHVSKELGDQQLSRKTSSTSTSSSSNSSTGAGGGGNDSSGVSNSSSSNEQIVIERVVLPSQIAGLPDLRGYLKTGGSHIVAKVAVHFDGLPRTGDQPDFQPIPQRPLPRYNPADNEQTTAAPAQVQQVVEQEQPKQEPNMEQVQLNEKYSAAVAAMVEEMLAEKGSDYIANLSDDDINDFAEIFAERAELLDQLGEL